MELAIRRLTIRLTEAINANHSTAEWEVRRHQATMPHSGCNQNPIRQPQSLLSHPQHCGATMGTCGAMYKMCSALLPPLCCQLRVLSPLQNPRSAWARPSDAAQALTGARLPPAGPSKRRHIAHRGRYPLQETPLRPLEPQGCQRDLRKARMPPRTTARPAHDLQSPTVYFL